jgi:hypothetical protein
MREKERERKKAKYIQMVRQTSLFVVATMKAFQEEISIRTNWVKKWIGILKSSEHQNKTKT